MELLQNTLVAFLPEIIVLITMLVVLAIDLFVAGPRHKIHRMTVLGLVLALSANWMLARMPAITSVELLLPVGSVLAVDKMALFLKGIVLLITILAVVFSLDSFDEEKSHCGEYYLLLLAATIGEMLAIGSRELLTFFVAFELLSLPLYILAGFRRYSSRSAEAGVKYFVTGALSSAFLLYGISWIYGSLGTTSFDAMGDVAKAYTHFPGGLMVGLLLMMVAFAFKISAAPFHNWSPDVYTGAPTPVVAYLSTAPKVAMVAVMLRFYWFAMPLVGRINLVATWMMIFVILSAISMTVGNLCALSQTNLKRMMAYSGVGQIGYVLMGLASCGAVTGFPGVVGAGWRGTAACLFYIAVYAVANLGVWAVISIAERNSGNADLDSMNGLAQRNPYLAFVLSICLMSLAGVPPLAGFFGKFFLFRAVYQANLPFLLVLGILNSVISLYYYFKVLRAAYFGNPPADRGNFGLSTAQAFCLGVCLVVCVGCGLNNRLNNWTERIPQYVEGIGR